MSVVYSTAVKNTRLNAVRDAIDAGGGSPNFGILQIGTSGMASVLANIALGTPSAPNAAGGVLTFAVPAQDPSAPATGTAAAARIRDSAGTDIVTGLTVTGTGGGGDIELDSVSITTGQTVTITSATITHG